MFPLYDSTPRRSFPFINYIIIALNLYVFWLSLTAVDFERFVSQYAFFPSQFNLVDPVTYIAVITSLFLHGGVLHILSNMWFLHLFGDNVEDTLGHFHYLVFYLLGGIAATLGQYFIDPTSNIPMVGASGAISAVAGAYLVYHRGSTIKALVPIFIIFTVVTIPVWLFLGYWFFIQLFSGLGSLSSMPLQDGGVAFFAHVAGFVFGFLYANLFRKNKRIEDREILS